MDTVANLIALQAAAMWVGFLGPIGILAYVAVVLIWKSCHKR